MPERDRPVDTLNPSSRKAWEMAEAIHAEDPKAVVYKNSWRPFMRTGTVVTVAEFGSYKNGDYYLPTSTGVIITTRELTFRARDTSKEVSEVELWKIAVGEDGGIRILGESIMDSAIPTSEDMIEEVNPLGETDTTTAKYFDAAVYDALIAQDAERRFETDTNFNLFSEADLRATLRVIPQILQTDDMKRKIAELEEDVDDKDPIWPATRQLLEDIIDELANQEIQSISNIDLNGINSDIHTQTKDGKLQKLELVTRRKKIDDPELETVSTWIFLGDSTPVIYYEEELYDFSSTKDPARSMMMLEYNNSIRDATAELSDDKKRANPDRIKEGLEVLEAVSNNVLNPSQKEKKHLDTAPMKYVLKQAFRFHQAGGVDTQTEHIGIFPQLIDSRPHNRIVSRVFVPAHDEEMLMSDDTNDYVSHQLSREGKDGSIMNIVICQNGVVRQIREDEEDPDTDDPDKNWEQIQGNTIGIELGGDILGEGEVSSILISLADEPGLSHLISDEERLFLDPNSKGQLEPLTRELLKRTITHLASTFSRYNSVGNIGDSTVDIETDTPFDCEPQANYNIPDSIANSSGVILKLTTSSLVDTRYELEKTWSFNVGKAKYYVKRILATSGAPDDVENEEMAVLMQSNAEESRDISRAIGIHGLPPMSADEWKEGMDLLDGLAS